MAVRVDGSGLSHRLPLMIFGTLQLLSGLGLIILDIVTFSLLGWWGVFISAGASGIWAGIFYLITGIFGAYGSRALRAGEHAESRRCLLITALILSILATLGSFVLMATFAAFLSFNIQWFFDCESPTTLCPDVATYAQPLLSAYLAFTLIVLVSSVMVCIFAGLNLSNIKSKAKTTTVTYVTTTVPAAIPAQVVYPQTVTVYPPLAPSPQK
ncbi:uncharacterized protein LOC129598239 [Paramacrobiotus metropolitanus]|uniref:uncharacterized protein LOC129598239 n=1 Tax=Paramacrobiotus metropolitanus TaxID=2943436 RepID=UPI0024456F99|nr:uncharacterized protein LOC129598239 [Paramacrobiotus metropolitanus]